MLTAVIFSLDATLADALRELMGRSRQIRLDKSVTRPVQNYEAVRVVNTVDPDLVLLDFSVPEAAAEIAVALRSNAPRAALLGIGRRQGVPEEVLDLVQGWLETPLRLSEVELAAVDAVRRHAGSRDQPFFTFLPAKAGCGATTAALHVADALANELGHPTLLVDADLRSGVVSVLLNVEPPRSVRDALANTADLQPSAWHDLVVRMEKLDVLAARPDQGGPLPLWTDYFKLMQFAGPRYQALVADLPELVNDATFELVRQSRRVFVVTTAELVALRLASQRLRELESRGVEAGRVSIVLNRWHKGDLSVDEVAGILKKPVVAVLPNDYRSVQKAALAGGIVNPETPLGKSYVEFAGRLWEGRDAEPARPRQVGGVKALLGLHR
jgi:Flp pilus assembly CpaE family ATPase